MSINSKQKKQLVKALNNVIAELIYVRSELLWGMTRSDYHLSAEECEKLEKRVSRWIVRLEIEVEELLNGLFEEWLAGVPNAEEKMKAATALAIKVDKQLEKEVVNAKQIVKIAGTLGKLLEIVVAIL